jgi:hypothetical protein
LRLLWDDAHGRPDTQRQVSPGLEKDFATNFFIRSTAKFGHVNLNDAVTSARGDKASHRFQFSEFSVSAGYRF